MINGNCMKPISGLLHVVVYKCGSGFRSTCFVCNRTIFGGLSYLQTLPLFLSHIDIMEGCGCKDVRMVGTW